jgi:hypothetical protein
LAPTVTSSFSRSTNFRVVVYRTELARLDRSVPSTPIVFLSLVQQTPDLLFVLHAPKSASQDAEPGSKMLDCQAEATTATANNSEAQGGEPKRKRPKIIGISEHMRIAEAKREQRNGPDSWAVRKVSCPAALHHSSDHPKPKQVH